MRAVSTVLFLVLVGALVGAPAGATHPGANGLIVLPSTDAGGIHTVAPDGSLAELRTTSAIQLEVSPDGRTILFSDSSNSPGIKVMSMAGGPVHTLVEREAGGRPDVSWSPDGSRFVVGHSDTVTVYDADGSNPQVLLDVTTDPNLGTRIDAVVWTQLNEVFAIQRFRESGARIDMNTGAVSYVEAPRGQYRTDTQFGLDSSPDGQQLTISCSNPEQVSGVCVLARDLGLIRFIPPSVVGQQRIQQPAWSPDGTRLAFLGTDNMTDFAAVYTATPEGSEVQLLTELPADPRFQGNHPNLASWARVPDTPPTPLEDPPPPPTNAPLACGGFDGNPATTERADFTDPAAYAVAISQARFCATSPAGPDADYVVLSRDDAFADSLTGAALTSRGPLLFTQTGSLPQVSRGEIDRLLEPGADVYVLGGEAAVSAGVEQQLAATYNVVRLAGGSRVETSVAVAREVMRRFDGDGDQVVVARAGGPADNPTAAWADSVSSGAWTAASSVPTVVTDTSAVHPAVEAFLRSVDPDETILLGGTAALSAEVEAAVPNPRRIAGASRAGTARAIATELIGDPEGDRTLVAINGFRADGWLFGLPAAGLAADHGGALALVSDPVPPETMAMACGPGEVDILLAGGLGIITSATADQLDQAPAC